MTIIIRLDRMMADRKMSLNELSDRVGVANVNLSKMKTGKVSAVRFSTLDAICDVLNCQPGDILEYQQDLPGSGTSNKGVPSGSTLNSPLNSPPGSLPNDPLSSPSGSPSESP